MQKKFLGKDFALFMERDAEMWPVCCGRDLSVSIQAETIELTKPPTGNWKVYTYGDCSYTASTSSLFVLGGFTAINFLDAIKNREELTFVTRAGINADLLLSGKVLVTSIELVGNNKEVIQYSVNLTGVGELSSDGTLYEYVLEDGEGNPLEDGEGNTLGGYYYSGDLPMKLDIEC